MRTVGISAALALTLACGIAFTGCGGEPPERTEWKTSETLPEDFAKTVPVYPQARVVKSVVGDGTVVVLRASATVKAVEEFYSRQLAEKGWAIRKAPGTGAEWMGVGGVTLTATRPGLSLNLSLGEEGQETVITAILKRKG